MIPSVKRLTLEQLWCLAVLVGVWAFAATHPIRPHDFWWHLALGRQIVSSGVIPAVDTFSYTANGQPYLSYQMFWLIEVAMYALQRAGGPALVLFVHSLLITGAYSLVTWLGWKLSGSGRAAAAGTLFAAALGFNDWNVRPQGVTFFLGTLLLWAIYQARTTRQRRWLIVFPLAMAVWANSHGSFVLGLLLIGAWLLDDFISWLGMIFPPLAALFPTRCAVLETVTSVFKASGLAILLAGLACLLNPRGVGIVTYLSGMVANPVIRNLVPEWAPPTFDRLDGALFLGGLLLAAVVLAVSPRRPSAGQLVIFVGFAALGLKTSRGEVWFGLAMAPILAEHLKAVASQFVAQGQAVPREGSAATFVQPEAEHRLWKANAALAGLLLLMAVIALPWFKDRLPFPPPKAGLISSETPIAATRYLVEHALPRPLFHAQSFGSYLIWAAQPDYPVFVDSRLELYPLSLWQDYIAISNAASDWEGRLAHYGIATLMLSPVEQPALIQAAGDSHHWTQVYGDDAAVLFVRHP